ncbi:hypothetical protein [Streptomyces virginiae]|uniref:Uncharacterized protein n=1 Tax=Streptomyces virginiae TaxID=1961 RepID=A0ABZ1T5P5_STRVG|nr:hypothetical protein [Streptomyces virginiae]
MAVGPVAVTTCARALVVVRSLMLRPPLPAGSEVWGRAACRSSTLPARQAAAVQ